MVVSTVGAELQVVLCEEINHTKHVCNCMQGSTLALHHIKLCICFQWSGIGYLLHLTYQPILDSLLCARSTVPLFTCLAVQTPGQSMRQFCQQYKLISL